MKKLFNDESGVVGVLAAVLISLFAGSVITVSEPKVAKFVSKEVLHQGDPNYEVPANPSPTKH